MYVYKELEPNTAYDSMKQSISHHHHHHTFQTPLLKARGTCINYTPTFLRQLVKRTQIYLYCSHASECSTDINSINSSSKKVPGLANAAAHACHCCCRLIGRLRHPSIGISDSLRGSRDEKRGGF